MDTLLLIDGNAIMHRAYHAIPLLKNDSGMPTNVIYGYLSMIYKIYSDLKPSFLLSCFDTPAQTFRNRLFKDYQSQRPKIDDDFIVQIPVLKQALDLSGIARLEKDGYEADDLIGTIAKIFANNRFRVVILSGDKDIFQLINENVFVASPQLGLANIKLFDKSEVIQKLEIEPDDIVDYKALCGDPSDNYPGAYGIGPKTAARLINEFKTVDNLYQNLNKVQSEKIRTILENEKENVYLSRKLAKIKTDVEIGLNIEKLKFSGFNRKLIDFLINHSMVSLVSRIFNEKDKLKKKENRPIKNDQMGLF